MNRSALILDDDPNSGAALGHALRGQGWTVKLVATGSAAVEAVRRSAPDLMFLDMSLPGHRNLEMIPLLKSLAPGSVIVMVAREDQMSLAVGAMRVGADDVVSKEIHLTQLEAGVGRAYEIIVQCCRGADHEADGGDSKAMRELHRRITKLARSDLSLLLLGESGTGKTWFAAEIHRQSCRAGRPFVEVNCAGLSVTFLHSELFGHEKGAFTDAASRKQGLFEVADGGTLFLDEIGDLPTELQPKLLKAVEARGFRRLGGNREIQSDVRIVAATNRNLERGVREGQFREDLFYRLSVATVHLPPLRDRGERYLRALTLSFFSELRRRYDRGPAHISPEALDLLVAFPWPGNLRQLRSVLERGIVMGKDGGMLRPSDLPPSILASGTPVSCADPRSEAPGPENPQAELPGTEDPAREILTLEELGRRHIEQTLAHFEGNRTRAAEALGISRVGLYKKLLRSST